MASNQKSMKQNQTRTVDGHFRCGYSVNNPNKNEARFMCLWCLLIIKEPYQLTGCGHRVCRGCFESRAATMSEDEQRQCPESSCEIPFRKDEVRTIISLGWTIFQTDMINFFSFEVHVRSGLQTWARYAASGVRSQRRQTMSMDWTFEKLSSLF